MKKETTPAKDHQCSNANCKTFTQHLAWLKKTPHHILRLIVDVTRFQN